MSKALRPAEDAILGFLNKMLNTGYQSSKITLNRIEKANQKRNDIGNEIEKLLSKLPNYNSKLPIVDDEPRDFYKEKGAPIK